MSDPLQVAVFGSLFVAGLAGSLHCLAMCGPLLLAFSQTARSKDPTDEQAASSGHGRRALRNALGSLYYHAGRIWTYALLGFFAGLAGSQMRLGASLLGWQRPLAVAASVLVLLSGLAALGVLPGVRLALVLPDGCFGTLSRWPWIGPLVRARLPLARFVLGTVMGLLPCGLVYAMLLLVATLPSPLHSALGMLCFGAGTLPALTALMLGSGSLPGWLRARSPRMTAVLLLGIGLWMLVRALLVAPHGMRP